MTPVTPHNPFKEFLPALRELQKIDARLRVVVSALQVIPADREEQGAGYLSVKKTLDQKEPEAAQIDKERLTLEQQSKESGEDIHRREERMNAIKTQQEYQATLKEIAQFRQAHKERENRILALMERGEKLTEEIAQLKSEASDKEGAYRELEKSFAEREGALKKEEEEMTARRPELLATLPAGLLKKYETVRKRHINGIVAILKGVCQGCFTNVPPQFFNEMLKHQDLRQCPHCSRLVFALLEPETIAGEPSGGEKGEVE